MLIVNNHNSPNCFLSKCTSNIKTNDSFHFQHIFRIKPIPMTSTISKLKSLLSPRPLCFSVLLWFLYYKYCTAVSINFLIVGHIIKLLLKTTQLLPITVTIKSEFFVIIFKSLNDSLPDLIAYNSPSGSLLLAILMIFLLQKHSKLILF